MWKKHGYTTIYLRSKNSLNIGLPAESVPKTGIKFLQLRKLLWLFHAASKEKFVRIFWKTVEIFKMHIFKRLENQFIRKTFTSGPQNSFSFVTAHQLLFTYGSKNDGIRISVTTFSVMGEHGWWERSFNQTECIWEI